MEHWHRRNHKTASFNLCQFFAWFLSIDTAINLAKGLLMRPESLSNKDENIDRSRKRSVTTRIKEQQMQMKINALNPADLLMKLESKIPNIYLANINYIFYAFCRSDQKPNE